jgi:hypothetical protein
MAKESSRPINDGSGAASYGAAADLPMSSPVAGAISEESESLVKANQETASGYQGSNTIADCKEEGPRKFSLPSSQLLDPTTGQPYCDNFVRTAKYTVASFLPIFLRDQFHPKKKFANVYFGIQSILVCIPQISPYPFYSTMLPFAFILFVAAVQVSQHTPLPSYLIFLFPVVLESLVPCPLRPQCQARECGGAVAQ